MENCARSTSPGRSLSLSGTASRYRATASVRACSKQVGYGESVIGPGNRLHRGWWRELQQQEAP